MPKEYRTIREVAGPLMMVSDVENVKYDELGEITVVKEDGETKTIIKNGRFVLEGTEELNKPMDE